MGEEARARVKDAVAYFNGKNDVTGEGSAMLLAAEVCLSTGRAEEALSQAQAAAAIFKQAGYKKLQADALLSVVSVELSNEKGQSIEAATERINLLRELG